VLRLADEGAALDRFVGIEQGVEHFPLDCDARQGGLGPREAVRRDRGDGRTRVSGLAGEDVQVLRADRRPDSR
jgi:hypothetical protein